MATTHPSSDTGRGPVPGRDLCLRWTFPEYAVTFFQGPSVVGREPTCGTVLAGNEVSRRHAEIRFEGPLVILRDLASRNGIFVNGERREEAPLANGDVVRLGDWVGIVVPEAHGLASLTEIAPGWFGGPKLAAAVEIGQRVAPTDLPIVIQGETGTGKEGLARALHAWSGRKGPLLAINCGAIAPTLVEAELFGYRKGAFTGADRAAAGFFRDAHGGTLLLDEVLELPPGVQVKLLRVLEQREVVPVGETRPIAIDVRIIAATQESLVHAVAEKRFRADLLARLDGTTVVLPPLRERRADVAPLFFRLLEHLTGGRTPSIEAKLVEALCLYDWPMNVREIVHLARALVATHGDEPILRKTFLPDRILARSRPSSEAAAARPARRSSADAEQFDALVDAVRAHAGNVKAAAQAIGVTRTRAYRLLDAHPDFDVGAVRPARPSR